MSTNPPKSGTPLPISLPPSANNGSSLERNCLKIAAEFQLPPFEDHDLSENAMGVLRLAFDLLDKDGDGVISSSDLGTSLAALGESSVSEAELTDLILDLYRPGSSNAFMSRPNTNSSKSRPGSQPQKIDTSVISFEIFAGVLNAKMRDAKQSKTNLINTLRAFDDSGSGFMEISKLKSILQHLGGSKDAALSDEDFAEIIETCRLDKSGKLNYFEFVDRMLAT